MEVLRLILIILFSFVGGVLTSDYINRKLSK